jgi:hypothetical protein
MVQDLIECGFGFVVGCGSLLPMIQRFFEEYTETRTPPLAFGSVSSGCCLKMMVVQAPFSTAIWKEVMLKWWFQVGCGIE